MLTIFQKEIFLTGVKRSAVTLESPTKKKCIVNLWRNQSSLSDNLGIFLYKHLILYT